MNCCSDCYVIMGAAVKPDGQPSGAMRRRVEGALAASAHCQAPRFIVTGGKGRFGPPESDLMRDLLVQAGVSPDRIVADPESTDTLQSVKTCASILKSGAQSSRVVVCTDRYHLPRCRWLFFLSGVSTGWEKMPNGRAAVGTARWTYYCIREVFAIVWDTVSLLFH